MKNNLARTIIELKENNNLNEKETSRLKKIFNSNDVDVVIACISNQVEKLKKYIEEGKVFLHM